LSLEALLSSESGAVTVDWVVLAAVITGLGLGLGSVATVRSGTLALGADIQSSLTTASAIKDIQTLDGFAFTRHTAGLQLAALDSFRQRDDALLLEHASGHAWNAMAALEAGDMEMARYWTERHYMSTMVLRERGLNVMDTYPNTPTLQQLREANDPAA